MVNCVQQMYILCHILWPDVACPAFCHLQWVELWYQHVRYAQCSTPH